MTASPATIVPFQDHHQAGIDELMVLTAREFTDPIFSPQSKTIQEVSRLPTDKYWVALIDNTVVGTIGFSMLKNHTIVLKRLFLNEAFRGQHIAQTLLNTVIHYAMDTNVSGIYLGTMTQFKAAHTFYEKQAFKKILRTALPVDFPLNPVDTVFYERKLK